MTISKEHFRKLLKTKELELYMRDTCIMDGRLYSISTDDENNLVELNEVT